MRSVLTTATVLGLILISLITSGCAESRLTMENYARIEEGMSLRQVEAVLGKGDKKGGGLSIGSFDASAYEVIWGNKKHFIAATLVNDEVITKVHRGLE